MRGRPVGLVVLPLLLALLSVPLALGWIEPNGLYGYRTPASLASGEAWYRANQAAGITGVFAGIAAFAGNLRLWRRADDSRLPTIAMAALVLAAAGLMVVAGFLALR